MSFKISIPNKSKINPPLMKSDLHGKAAGHFAVHPKGVPLPSDINGTHSDKIRRPSNSDRLKSNDNIQRPSVMKSGESTPRLENDIFSKKPSFLYTSTFCSDRIPSDMDLCASALNVENDIFSKKPSFLYTSTFCTDRIPSDMDLCASALKVENDIFSKKPSFLYAKSTRQMGVEKDIFSNKPSFLYTDSEEHPATFGGDHVAASDIIEINPVNKDKNFSRNFIYERKETIDSLDNAPWGAPYERRY